MFKQPKENKTNKITRIYGKNTEKQPNKTDKQAKETSKQPKNDKKIISKKQKKNLVNPETDGDGFGLL